MFGELTQLLCAAPLAVAAVHLVERRGRREALDPHRHVELATLLHSLPEAALLFDERRELIEVNFAAEQLYRRSRSELLTMRDKLIADGDGAGIHLPSHFVDAALRGETTRQARRSMRISDERTADVLVSASPVRGGSGEIVGAVIILRDITELGILEQRLADTERHRAIGQLAAGIAHDFNNVLEAISQAVFILEMNAEAPAEERRTYTRMIERAVKRGAEISERMRQYLRGSASDQQDVWLKSTLEDVIELTRPLWSRHKGIRLHTEFNDPPPVRGNLADLRRVFTNLIINAVEAMPDGGTITVRCEAGADGARVSVSDTGSGISPKDQKRIFNPYFTTKKEGTGLGLSGAKRIVTAAHGKIYFETEQGRGTTFVVELRYAHPQQRWEEGLRSA